MPGVKTALIDSVSSLAVYRPFERCVETMATAAGQWACCSLPAGHERSHLFEFEPVGMLREAVEGYRG